MGQISEMRQVEGVEVWQLIQGGIGLVLVLVVGIVVWAVLPMGQKPRPPKKPWWKRRYDEEGYDRRGYDRNGYDRQGYNRRGYDQNGYDRQGYNRRGYDRNGYNRQGYDVRGYDRRGYNGQGYDVRGRDIQGRYNRLYNVADFAASRYSAEGFLDPRIYPVGMTSHGRQRMEERVPGQGAQDPWGLTMDAYCYGKSARQLKPSSAYWVREKEKRHENGIVLLYQGYVYIFSRDNQLITVYKNERISV